MDEVSNVRPEIIDTVEEMDIDTHYINPHLETRIIFEKEKRAIFAFLKKTALKNNAIIFGGFIRDELIAGHYRTEFFKKYNSAENFWDKSFDTETLPRMIVPNDLDCYFKQSADAGKFIATIQSTFERVVIGDVLESHYINGTYLKNINHKKIEFTYIIGKTYTFSGFKLKFKIDCLVQKNSIQSVILEPPFNTPDMLCNMFVETNEGVRLSKDTGTRLDTLNGFEKMKVSYRIMNDMINFKTELITKKTSSYFSEEIYNKHNEGIMLRRVIKMTTERRNSPNWEIKNLPYSIVNRTTEDMGECVICKDELNNAEYDRKIAITYFPENSKGEKKESCRCHNSCMNNHLISLTKRKDTESIRCPYNNPLNFCNIEPDYTTLLQ